MSTTGLRREQRRGFSVLLLLVGLCLPLAIPLTAVGQIGVELQNEVPGWFDPDDDLRAPKPYRAFGADSLAQFNHEAILFRYETEFDSANGYYLSTRDMFGRQYGRTIVESREDYREWRFKRDRQKFLQDRFRDEIIRPTSSGSDGPIEIQVPFKIKNKTFRRIFGGDRVGLRVSGRITVDGGLRREKSDQVITTQNDQSNTSFKIEQTQQFRIVGKVGDKVSVEIDQDSERVFDFENNVKLEYQGYEDEIIQSIEAGNVSMTLAGTQLATLSAKNQGLFGFKTVSQVGPLSITTIASLQKGEKNKLSYTGGSESQTYQTDDREFVRDQYFFLDYAYRDNYPNYNSEYKHYVAENPIQQIEVYKSVQGGDVSDLYEGWAVYFENMSGHVPDMAGKSKQEIIDQVNTYNNDTDLQSADYAETGFFKKLQESEYEYDPNLGYIRLRYRANVNEVVAVAYTVEGSSVQYGTLQPPGNHVILKLLKPTNPKSDNPTWDLSWKHVYWVGTTGLKAGDFNFRLLRSTDQSETNASGTSWMELFGLDVFNADGASTPDGIIDDIWLDATLGEIHFPDLTPFAPSGYTVSGEDFVPDLSYGEDDEGNTLTYANPEIYTISPTDNQPVDKNFILESEYSNTSANINLGINVLEGSEEIFLNGALLKKDEDYIIDYLSGSITILNQAAFDANANLEIKYESGEVFQLDRRTMLGIRLEYALWEDSFVGLTLLNFDEQPIEKRVKVGNEPLANFLWDANTRLRFHPYIMTQMVNALPLINTDEPSEIVFEGEIAQVFPNPNSLNNSGTGDNNGVAYIDDFEAAQRATPLGVRRKNWYPASHPVRMPSGILRTTADDDTDWRARFFWYNPFNQVPITDIWPNREVNSKVPNNTDVLSMEFDPEVNNHRSAEVEPSKTWNGVMRALSAGFHNQRNTKFLEVWMKWTGGGPDATIYFDMGQISEDVIPDGILNTEDEPLFAGSQIGNEILDPGEDVGLDGIQKGDPPWRVGNDRTGDPWTVEDQGYDFTSETYDWWDIDTSGTHDPGEPFSSDNWRFDRADVDQINGTQGNEADEARYPDTEDLDGDRNLTKANNFFRYQFQLYDQEDEDRFVRGGLNNNKGWRLIRIPLEDVYDEVNDPDLSQIEFFRIWMKDFTAYGKVDIAQVELVGNEWLEDPIVNQVTGDTTVYLTASTINTYDNPEDYNPPPGVAGEIDPITDIRSKEQSLVISLQDMPTAAEGQLIKRLYNDQDLREYRQLKMFVHGGGRNPENLAGKDLEFFLRFGSGVEGANLGYYEYSLPIKPGWSDNEIVVSLDRLTRLKTKQGEQGGDFAAESLPGGHAIKVVGDPSIGSVSLYAVGVRNIGRPVAAEENIEVWVDELRLSGVRKEKGMAMRSSLDFTFADFMDFQTNMSQRDSEFHSVDERTGRDKSTIDASVTGSMQLDKFLDPSLGIRLPLRGSVKSDLSIPKYTNSNGDVRTESLVDKDELNVWKRFGELALSRKHMQDRYLRGAQGQVLIDETSGVPLQDLAKWGVDTLFDTGQDYSWSLGYSKNRESGHWLPKYTVDNITTRYSHAQRYSTNLRYQYNKTFSNQGNVDYSLNLEQQELEIFNWTEGLWVLEDLLYDNKLNYLPSRVKLGASASEEKKSQKLRNAFERPSYRLTLSRDFGTSLRPFRSMNFDFDYAVDAQHIREDSTRQQILYNDQPDAERAQTFEPGTNTLTMIESLQDTLRLADRFQPGGGQIADEAEAALNEGVNPEQVLNDMYAAIQSEFPNKSIRQRWDPIQQGDPEFDDRFWTVGTMPFANTNKTQNVRFNYSPNLLSWLTTSFDYTSRYSWSWNGFKYSQRTVQTNNNLGGSLSLRVRQLVPAESGGGTQQDAQARDFARLLGRDDEEEEGEEADSTSSEEADEEAQRAEIRARQMAMLKALNPVDLGIGFLRKMQDIRLNYSQSTAFSNPGILDGEPSWDYKVGLTGDPGLGMVENTTSFASSNRTDDYRVSSGVDWSTRLSTSLDYNMTFSESAGNRISGTDSRSSLYLQDGDDISKFDVPNYQLRWSGLEQFGPLQQIAQAITFNHSYSGEYREQWEIVYTPPTDSTLGFTERQIQSKAYKRNFSPLAGFNITWLHGISTNVRYELSEGLNETSSNNTRTKDTRNSISVSASYRRTTGFRIPIPIWPFKNRRFDNETTFNLDFTRSETRKETQRDGGDFETTNKQLNWSLSPSISYSFSRNVSGSIRYKYGVTETTTNTKKFQEFGINVSINIRG